LLNGKGLNRPQTRKTLHREERKTGFDQLEEICG
jgi:hypothetical protein